MRLITGMQCYQELVYLLDFLLAYDRFELLLRKRINNDEGQTALRLALHSYLLKRIHINPPAHLFITSQNNVRTIFKLF